MSEDDPQVMIPLNKSPKLFPNNPPIGNVVRWANRGIQTNGDGTRVKLQTRKIGGRRYTCQKFIDDFLAQLNGERRNESSAPRQRRRSVLAAEHELDADGIN